MTKEDLVEMQGLVGEVRPDSRFRVKLENGHELMAFFFSLNRHNKD